MKSIHPAPMSRRDFLGRTIFAVPAAGVLWHFLHVPGALAASAPMDETCAAPEKIVKSRQEWEKILTPEEFHVLREKGTERAFTGSLLKNKTKGVYACKGCGLSLFSSDAKFDSGTGWPSFWRPICQNHVKQVSDTSFFMVRIEVLCARCHGHLGHVFKDGPPPTGLRYCINSVSLKFVAAMGTN